jgi:endonuclease/exonuclease/phosphatase family metal-dependent hydrolase
MLRYFVALALLLTLAAGETPPKRTVRVLTYNIHHGEGSDEQFDLPRIARVISEARPDLVALQEVDEKTNRSSGVSQITELGRLTGMHPVFGQAMEYDDGGYGVGILSRWTPLTMTKHPLPGNPQREPRVALSITTRPAADAATIMFTSTHLDFGRNDFRDQQALALNQMLATDDHTLSILGGDMNSDSDVIRILRERWQELDTPGLTAMSGQRLIYRLDYLFVRPASSWRLVEGHPVDAPLASDHVPVLAVLGLVD